MVCRQAKLQPGELSAQHTTIMLTTAGQHDAKHIHAVSDPQISRGSLACTRFQLQRVEPRDAGLPWSQLHDATRIAAAAAASCVAVWRWTALNKKLRHHCENSRPISDSKAVGDLAGRLQHGEDRGGGSELLSGLVGGARGRQHEEVRTVRAGYTSGLRH